MKNLIITIILMLMTSTTFADERVGKPLLTECEVPDGPMNIQFVLYDDEKELTREWKRLAFKFKFDDKKKMRGRQRGVALTGFHLYAKLKNGDFVHFIHALKPKGQEDSRAFEILGHEVSHALCGDYHD